MTSTNIDLGDPLKELADAVKFGIQVMKMILENIEKGWDAAQCVIEKAPDSILNNFGDLLGVWRHSHLHSYSIYCQEGAFSICLSLTHSSYCGATFGFGPLPFNLTLALSLSLTHSLSVIVVMMKSRELKTKLYSHAHSLILTHTLIITCCCCCHCEIHATQLSCNSTFQDLIFTY